MDKNSDCINNVLFTTGTLDEPEFQDTTRLVHSEPLVAAKEHLAALIAEKQPKELAIILGISEQAVYKALKKQVIPSTWVHRVLSKLFLEADEPQPASATAPYEQGKKQLPPTDMTTACAQCLQLYERLYQSSESEKKLLRRNMELQLELEQIKIKKSVSRRERSKKAHLLSSFAVAALHALQMQQKTIHSLHLQIDALQAHITPTDPTNK